MNKAKCRPPHLSIITVVFNGETQLGAVVDSISKAREKSDLFVEFIIIDGSSTDSTVDLIRSRSDEIDRWISEPDGGLYDAMNKGVRMATGEWLYFINCGDQLVNIPDCLQTTDDKHEIVAGQVLINGWYTYSPRWDWLFRFGNHLHHQGTFYRRANMMPYDLNYPIFADINNNQLMFKAGYSCMLLDELVAVHNADGVSSHKIKRLERYRVFYHNFGISGVIGAAATYLVRGLNYHLRRLISRPQPHSSPNENSS